MNIRSITVWSQAGGQGPCTVAIPCRFHHVTVTTVILGVDSSVAQACFETSKVVQAPCIVGLSHYIQWNPHWHIPETPIYFPFLWSSNTVPIQFTPNIHLFLLGLPMVCPRARKRQPAKCSKLERCKFWWIFHEFPWYPNMGPTCSPLFTYIPLGI